MRSRALTRVLDQRGVSLIEVSISALIFAIGLLGLARMYVLAGNSDSHGRQVERATMIGNELLGWLQTVPFDGPLLVDTDTSAPATPGPNNGDLLDEGMRFAVLPTLTSTLFDHDGDGVVTGTPEIPDAAVTGVVDPCAGSGRSCLFRGHLRGGVVDCANPTPRPRLDVNCDGSDDFERYWIVADRPPRLGETRSPGKGISVIVRWRDRATDTHRRVVVYGFRFNPEVLIP